MTTPLIYQNNNYLDKDIYYPIYTKEIIRTEQIYISPEDKFSCGIWSYYCHISKNIYNEANYEARQEYAKYDHYMGYNDLEYLVKKKYPNYKLLPAATAQQIIRKLDKNGWWNFLERIKDYYIHPGKYLGKPGLPGYSKKNGEFILVFTGKVKGDKKKKKRQVSIKNGYLDFPKKINKKPSRLKELNGKIKTRLDDETDLNEIRVIPNFRGGDNRTGYTIEIVYTIEEHVLDLNKENVIGLDFGVRNIVAIANNIGEKPVVIKGGVLKSINQFYNKMRAEIQSIYSKQPIMCLLKNKKVIYRKTGRAIQILTWNRNKKIKDAMHKYSKWVIGYCIYHNIGTIVIGYNPDWKQEINLGKRNNQNFAYIPFDKLVKMIQYKADEIGISVIMQEESHTSKCSFLDGESIEHHDSYMGKRTSRGLFRSSNGTIVNADVQGAYNTIKNAIPEAFKKLGVDWIEDVGLHPLRINPLVINRNINIVGS